MPAHGTKNQLLPLIDPDSPNIGIIGGFSERAGYSGGHGEGITSSDAGRSLIYVTDRSSRLLDILVRHRAQPDVRGFVKGAYAAAIGTILGASVLLGRIAIGDWLTTLIAAISLIILFR